MKKIVIFILFLYCAYNKHALKSFEELKQEQEKLKVEEEIIVISNFRMIKNEVNINMMLN